MRINRYLATLGLGLALAGSLIALGCYSTPEDVSERALGPAPLRIPSPANKDGCCYEDQLEGHHIFDMYCAACHNARPLAERPFSNYQNAVQHMRVRANLTGQEYAKLMAWLRRWDDIPPPNPAVEPSPKRFIFSQPINELRQQKPPAAAETPRPNPADAQEGEGEQQGQLPQ
jgi:hypothetical protein